LHSALKQLEKNPSDSAVQAQYLKAEALVIKQRKCLNKLKDGPAPSDWSTMFMQHDAIKVIELIEENEEPRADTTGKGNKAGMGKSEDSEMDDDQSAKAINESEKDNEEQAEDTKAAAEELNAKAPPEEKKTSPAEKTTSDESASKDDGSKEAVAKDDMTTDEEAVAKVETNADAQEAEEKAIEQEQSDQEIDKTRTPADAQAKSPEGTETEEQKAVEEQSQEEEAKKSDNEDAKTTEDAATTEDAKTTEDANTTEDTKTTEDAKIDKTENPDDTDKQTEEQNAVEKPEGEQVPDAEAPKADEKAISEDPDESQKAEDGDSVHPRSVPSSYSGILQKQDKSEPTKIFSIKGEKQDQKDDELQKKLADEKEKVKQMSAKENAEEKAEEDGDEEGAMKAAAQVTEGSVDGNSSSTNKTGMVEELTTDNLKLPTNAPKEVNEEALHQARGKVEANTRVAAVMRVKAREMLKKAGLPVPKRLEPGQLDKQLKKGADAGKEEAVKEKEQEQSEVRKQLSNNTEVQAQFDQASDETDAVIEAAKAHVSNFGKRTHPSAATLISVEKALKASHEVAKMPNIEKPGGKEADEAVEEHKEQESEKELEKERAEDANKKDNTEEEEEEKNKDDEHDNDKNDDQISVETNSTDADNSTDTDSKTGDDSDDADDNSADDEATKAHQLRQEARRDLRKEGKPIPKALKKGGLKKALESGEFVMTDETKAVVDKAYKAETTVFRLVTERASDATVDKEVAKTQKLREAAREAMQSEGVKGGDDFDNMKEGTFSAELVARKNKEEENGTAPPENGKAAPEEMLSVFDDNRNATTSPVEARPKVETTPFEVTEFSKFAENAKKQVLHKMEKDGLESEGKPVPEALTDEIKKEKEKEPEMQALAKESFKDSESTPSKEDEEAAEETEIAKLSAHETAGHKKDAALDAALDSEASSQATEPESEKSKPTSNEHRASSREQSAADEKEKEITKQKEEVEEEKEEVVEMDNGPEKDEKEKDIGKKEVEIEKEEEGEKEKEQEASSSQSDLEKGQELIKRGQMYKSGSQKDILELSQVQKNYAKARGDLGRKKADPQMQKAMEFMNTCLAK